ncbi:MAG: L,D-transpeptidase family protein [Pelagibacterales bacterium]|nr:L,D-transpeptidase family protein [Pelagibacterales bacterium]
MLIRLKNKDKLIIDDFILKCCIGKNGVKKQKIEGDNSTPKGIFTIGTFYYRKDRVIKPFTNLKTKIIKPNIGWCNDSKKKSYNKEIKIKKLVRCEKLFRKDHMYDYLIVINYNTTKIIPNKGSAIFIHLTKNYHPTAGCIALKKQDFIILLKLINNKTKIVIS